MAMPFNQESWIWYTVAAMMIGARLISRRMLFRSLKGLQYDDWIMAFFVTGCYTVLIVLSNKWVKTQSNLLPPSFDFSTLTAEELSQRRLGSKYVVVVEQTQIAVIWACKACLLIMYHRLTRTALRNENVAIKLLSAYVAFGFVVMEVLYFAAWCRPFSEYLAVPTRSRQCNALVHHRITKAVFNISSDLIMLVIALQMLLRSLLPLKRKLILCGIFSLGIFVVAASILNSYYSFKNPYGSTWIFWYVRESSTAILVANLPFTWTLLRTFFELGDFDETNPPPWTYHSSRTAGGRKTAQLMHQTGATGIAAKNHQYAPNSNRSRGTNSNTSRTPTSRTLLGTTSTGKDASHSPGNTSQQSSENEKELLEEAIHPHDFAPNNADIDLEHGLPHDAHLRPLSPSPTEHENIISSSLSPAKITQDGTGGFYLNNRPVSPPSRAYLAANAAASSKVRSRDPSISSVDRRPMSPAPSHTSSAMESVVGGGGNAGRRGSAASIGGGVVGGTAGGGRSARDRRVRTKRMSKEGA
ncbi:Nn.00g014270.m01.CDS01 [Neocucurbitaria sp. VM-36]